MRPASLIGLVRLLPVHRLKETPGRGIFSPSVNLERLRRRIQIEPYIRGIRADFDSWVSSENCPRVSSLFGIAMHCQG